MFFCRYCGAKVYDDSVFCSFCGKKLLIEGEKEDSGAALNSSGEQGADSRFVSDPEFVWDLHQFPEVKPTEDADFEWEEEIPPEQEEIREAAREITIDDIKELQTSPAESNYGERIEKFYKLVSNA